MVEPESPSRIALVSDDDALIRRVVALALESAGWTVLESADIATERDAVDAGPLDVCVLDRHMPGPALDARLDHVAHVQPGAAIVVLSGDGEAPARDGVVYLGKPVELHELLNGVARARESALLRNDPARR